MPYPVILGGDHAAFEAEHANTKPEDRPDWPLPSFDAQDWAKAFMARVGADTSEDVMVTWFANALMRGYDEHAARAARKEWLMAGTIYDIIANGNRNAFPDGNELRALRLCLISEVYQRYYFAGIDIRVVVNGAWVLEQYVITDKAADLTKVPYPTVPLPAMPPAPAATP